MLGRCNRKFPCSNCIKSHSQCVPATLATRRRRRQVPELLERLHKYEDLLRQNNIDFEALPENLSGERRSGSRQLGPQGGYDSDDGEIDADRSSPSATFKSDVVYETKYIFPPTHQVQLLSFQEHLARLELSGMTLLCVMFKLY